ncbi:Holliday junction endonuclease RuvC [Halopolyspora algeriensis]|uniref:Crossover junction endodeoxyribonuclease RuvC n=1 Tax=Halopolyspora algeriensis TaxID=1500506 RepID=A0A368VPX6_9ACTN|nr:crossover junction endodeoxyribonuclease RuvC [Halopolyspora algeriensis]RCW43911.1 Holliday junction endonuclease RuvC [Halopolyspora algeriensis]TQM53586.1 Holliday junction endonuclease RuvC [Halopolyspora algeriensis]
MRVLGVDPGLTRCGVGVIESGRAHEVTCLAVGVVRTPAGSELPARLMTVADTVEQWMHTHQPDVVAIERVFSQQNVRTVMGTAQVSGVVALAAARRDVPVAFHTPSAVKAAISGSGTANKKQVTAMITKILGLESPPRPADAADALALAVCHLWRSPMAGRLAEAEAKAAELARHHRARLKEAGRSRSARQAGGSSR